MWQKLYVLQSLLNTPGTKLLRRWPAGRIDLTGRTYPPWQGYGASESFILQSVLNCPASLEQAIPETAGILNITVLLP